MLLVEQDLLTFPEYLSSPPVFSWVRVTRSVILCVCFVDRCLSFCPFSFGHFVVCPSSIYGFWLPFGIFKLILNNCASVLLNHNYLRRASFPKHIQTNICTLSCITPITNDLILKYTCYKINLQLRLLLM
jgi:hypothetical protein